MKFTSIYQNIEQRISDTVLSLWATGDPDFQNYLLEIFKQEKLMAEPIFQNMFPWEPSTSKFGELGEMFSPDFINRLDSIKNEEYRFPSDRNPYLHQEKSWQAALNDKKSLLVTTGTGSGKTECFMLPVLQDIYQNYPNSIGVNAIFLYPLNALIGSQKKRMHAWCEALRGHVKYAVYNGNTPESVTNNIQNQALPEIISRQGIRQNTPQILFTNPTMLEYMLVRDKDTELLRNSIGKLRWILLDEAHTLVGSKAAEMALLIRRVIEAFEVDLQDVRFAVTSATVGDGNDEAIKKFMADLCGISQHQIELIKGKRVMTSVDDETLLQQQLSPEIIHKIRDIIYQKPSVNASEVGKIANLQSLHEQLEFMDKVSEIEVNGMSSLPVRGHFFARNISGLYACTNPNCTVHPNRPKGIWGSITTLTKKQCSCGFPMLELVSCQSCGTYMLEGEEQNEKIMLSSRVVPDLFQVEDEDNAPEEPNPEENKNQPQSSRDRILLLSYQENINNLNTDNSSHDRVVIAKSGQIINDTENPTFLKIDEKDGCPCCGEALNKIHHFRLSAAFVNRLVSDVILEQMDDMHPLTSNLVWNGRKYISFTDSRQGTAKISALINQDNETYFLRSQVFHQLCKKYKSQLPPTLTEERRQELQVEKDALVHSLNLVPPIAQPAILKQIVQIDTELNSVPPPLSVSRKTWNELRNELEQLTDTQTLFYNSHVGKLGLTISQFCNALLYDEFYQRLSRERTLENLGMVNLVYPGLENITLPDILKVYGLTRDEWHQLIKISLDYIIRNRRHILVSPTIRGISQKKMFSIPIYPSDTTVGGRILKWPILDRTRNQISRLPLLLCAGLGFCVINQREEEIVNLILDELWKVIKSKFLVQDGNGDNDSYKLNLESKAAFQLADKLWLCPVKKRLLDTTFRGYSPWITGRLNTENLEKFKVGEPLQFPTFPYPFNRDENNNLNRQNTLDWIQNDPNVVALRNSGMWNSMHERILNFKPVYLAGEHSAQQSKTRLENLEKNFQDGKLNILSCSTTMEMGVDIGGISAVVMSNVPPSPANYLQRTGRAGRRRENKSMALTLCPSNPVGLSVMENPSWALDHKISPPSLRLNSKTVVEKHLNAFFLGKFVRSNLDGMNVKEKVEDFFFSQVQNQIPPSEMFLTYLTTQDSSLFVAGIRHIIKNTPLQEKRIVGIIRTVVEHFQRTKELVEEKVKSFDDTLSAFLIPINIGGEFGYTQNSPAYKAVNYQKKNFLKKNVLTFLSESGFLPAGGIPTGIVEFNTKFRRDINNNNDSHVSMPSYHLTRALAEYAPGMEVVIDGWTYTSGGIELQGNFGQQASKSILQHCTSCGHEQILVGNLGLDPNCPVCKNNTLRGVSEGTSFTEIIEPAGFAVDLNDSKNRQIKETSNTQYIEPLLINVQPWQDSSHPVVEYRDSLPNAEIVYYNNGSGEGFSICLNCGKASQDPSDLIGHTRLRGGIADGDSLCQGNANLIRENVMLVGRFQTDFFEIRFRNENGGLINDNTTLYTLGNVLVKSLCTYLAIEEQEIDFGVKKYNGFKTVFLFDTAKGGAGYVAQCADHFEIICKEALAIVSRTCCDTACTKCLIDRKSQFHLEYLDKGAAKNVLERIVEQTTPPEIAEVLSNNPKKVIGDVKSEIARYFSKKQLTKLTLFVDGSTINEWEADQFVLLNHVANDVSVQLVFRGDAALLDNDQIISLIQLKAALRLQDIYYTRDYELNDLQQIARIELSNQEAYDYYASNFVSSLGPQWGTVRNDFTYRQEAQTDLDLSVLPLNINLRANSTYEIFIDSQAAYVDSDSIFDLFYNKLPDDAKVRMAEWLNGKSVKVIYSDRYVSTPLGCLLLIQFLAKIRDKFQATFEGADIRLKGMSPSQYPAARYISNTFVSDAERTNFIKELTASCGLQNVTVELNFDLPHYRFFKIDIEGEKNIIIRPDAGIEHGWYAQNKYLDVQQVATARKQYIYQKMNKSLLYTISFNE